MSRREIEQVLAAKALIYALAGKEEKSEEIRAIIMKLQEKDRKLARI